MSKQCSELASERFTNVCHSLHSLTTFYRRVSTAAVSSLAFVFIASCPRALKLQLSLLTNRFMFLPSLGMLKPAEWKFYFCSYVVRSCHVKLQYFETYRICMTDI